MRQLRFVGLTADGASIVVERDGEHLVLPLDDRVRTAVAGQVQMPMPLAAPLSPRDIQRRIRAGESAARLAADSGVPVEKVARFEGPVLAERDHHAEQARKVVVDGVPLGERVADIDPDAAWDSWLDGDGAWRVQAAWADDGLATWSWDPATRRLRPLDPAARALVEQPQIPAADDLEAVLRPLGSARHVSLVSAPEPVAEGPDAETDTAPVVQKRRRASVPSWEEITTGRTSPPGGSAPA